VVETCGSPDNSVGEFEFVCLAERDRFSSHPFVKFNYGKLLPEKIFPNASEYVGWCANEHFHPGDPADRDALVAAAAAPSSSIRLISRDSDQTLNVNNKV
jgi:hypothetical protein